MLPGFCRYAPLACEENKRAGGQLRFECHDLTKLLYIHEAAVSDVLQKRSHRWYHEFWFVFSSRVQSIGNALLLWRVVRISANSFLRIIMNYSVLLNVTEMVIAIIHIANRIIRKLLFPGRVGSCMILHEITSYHFWADGNSNMFYIVDLEGHWFM